MPEEAVKEIYFIRHSKTLLNGRRIHQGEDEPLALIGIKQAEAVAKEMKELKIDTLVSSPFVRARETAEIISEHLDLPIITNHSVVEFRRPNGLYNRGYYTPATVRYLYELFRKQSHPEWDYDGAENMFDIRNRIEDAKRELAALDGKRIAVVSHSIFITMLVKMVCADRPLKFREFATAVSMADRMPHCSYVKFTVDTQAPNGTCRWWYNQGLS